MKNKIVLYALLVFALIATLAFAFTLAGCGGKGAEKIGKHIGNPDGMGGENVLDDGGAIIQTGPTQVLRGVAFKKEKRIVLGLDDDDYELRNAKVTEWTGAYAAGVPEDVTIDRCQITSPDSSITFEFDFSGVEDKSRVGCRVTLISTRSHTTLSVSTDMEHWTEIGYPDTSAVSTSYIKCDYGEHITDLRNAGYEINDNNLWQFYYLLGDYIGESDVIYLRAGYSDEHNGVLTENGVGADIIDHVSYFESLDLVYETV